MTQRRGRRPLMVKVIIEQIACSPEEREKAWFDALETVHRLAKARSVQAQTTPRDGSGGL